MDKFIGICCGAKPARSSGFNHPFIERCSLCGRENFGSYYWIPDDSRLGATRISILVHDPDANPVGVEAYLRCEHGTLDALSPRQFAHEIAIARETEAAFPGHLRTCAQAYGGRAWLQQYDQWEQEQMQEAQTA
ncbi:MAG: hypothetical protein F4X54_07430 [Chloroflexi bacterium]|nr:hypothetical protein [Chloroflexota bacterium]MYB84549.1 hypothetical protein [Chloroflexota bacterium]